MRYLFITVLLGVTACFDAPSTPTGLTAQGLDQSVLLTWNPPPEGEEVARHVIYTTSDGLYFNQVAEVAMPATSFLVEDVVNEATYRFAIDAWNGRGYASLRTSSVTATPNPAPKLVESTPARSASNVPLNTPIRLRFSEPMDVPTVDVQLSPAGPLGAPTWGPDKDTVSFQPPSGLAHELTYTVTLTGKDLTGIPLKPTSFTFTTEPAPRDTQPPQVVSSYPAEGMTVSADSSLSFTFSEPMARASVEAAFRAVPALTCAFTWDSQESTSVTCKPTPAMTTQTQYTVTLTGARDMAGNPLSEGYSLSFSTSP